MDVLKINKFLNVLGNIYFSPKMLLMKKNYKNTTNNISYDEVTTYSYIKLLPTKVVV